MRQVRAKFRKSNDAPFQKTGRKIKSEDKGIAWFIFYIHSVNFDGIVSTKNDGIKRHSVMFFRRNSNI